MGPPRLLRYYIGEVIEIYYNITLGGWVLPIYYNITMGGRGGGSLGTPNFYYVIYGRPLRMERCEIGEEVIHENVDVSVAGLVNN